MNYTTSNTLFKLSKKELLALSYDFIRLNRNFTNEQIPDFLLQFWAIPNYSKDSESNDVALLIFRHILDLDSEEKERMEITLGTYRFSQLFHVFQLILATTIYSRKYHLLIEPFYLFRIEEYNVPQLEKPEQLLKEYLRVIKPIDSKKKGKTPKKKYQFEISIAPSLSNLIFIEDFIRKLITHYYLTYPLSEQISKSIMAAVNHAILFVNKSNEEKYISIDASKNVKEFKVKILCGDKSDEPKRHKFNPPMPTDNNDLKGWYLYSMKNIPDKISFLDDGAEVTLVFYN